MSMKNVGLKIYHLAYLGVFSISRRTSLSNILDKLVRIRGGFGQPNLTREDSIFKLGIDQTQIDWYVTASHEDDVRAPLDGER